MDLANSVNRDILLMKLLGSVNFQPYNIAIFKERILVASAIKDIS